MEKGERSGSTVAVVVEKEEVVEQEEDSEEEELEVVEEKENDAKLPCVFVFSSCHHGDPCKLPPEVSIT